MIDNILRIDTLEQRVAELYSKQGRVSQFKSVQERDTWLHKEIQTLSDTLAQKKQQVPSSCLSYILLFFFFCSKNNLIKK